jgi:hypothetical protein
VNKTFGVTYSTDNSTMTVEVDRYPGRDENPFGSLAAVAAYVDTCLSCANLTLVGPDTAVVVPSSIVRKVVVSEVEAKQP